MNIRKLYSRLFVTSLSTTAILFAVIFSLLAGPIVKAATWDGRGMYYGYFNNVEGHSAPGNPYPSKLGPVLPNNDYATTSIPYSVNTTAALYEFLYDRYTHTGPYGATYGAYTGVPRAEAWDRTGVSFIVNSMLGRNGNQANRNLGPADWSELQRRLGTVGFKVENRNTGSYGCVNTYYQYANDDVAYYCEPSEERPSIILTYGGAEVFILFYSCANPIGNFAGLPNIDYNLKPTISVNPAAAAEPGTTVNVNSTVTNSGSTASTPDVQWQVNTFTVGPAPAGIPGGGLSFSPPATVYGNGAQLIASGTRSFPRGSLLVNVISQVLADKPVGSRVCFGLSVMPYSASAPGVWYHSVPACVTIAKKPKVQVLSGDLEVGRGSSTNPAPTAPSNINTSTTTKGGLTYGSWAEYGILPTGTVTGMASAAGYARGTTATSMCSLSLLTFTSGSSGGSCGATIGKFVQATIAPNVSARFPINVPSDVATPAKPASPAPLPKTTLNIMSDNLSGQYQAPAGATALTITGGNNIPQGRWVVINAPNATVTITGNISYTPATLHSLADIPQVVIIAKNILIADNVTQIDSWLVAVGSGTEGRLNTCATGAAGVTETSSLTYKDCAQPLVVNGPVITNHLIMRRTAGADAGADSGKPAETFNLRADAYLWATHYNLNTGRLATVATKELPPRF